MGSEQEKDHAGVGSSDEFSKSEDKQQIPTGGVTDGVDFAESLPGGGEDNENSSLTTGDDDEFDHRNDDDEKS